jgi:uncharacterized protein (TIGR02099 family)
MPLSALGASLVRKFWALFVILLMLVAIYVSVGRMVMPHLQNYQPELEQALSEALGVQVTAERLEGGWQGFNPLAKLRTVSLTRIPGANQEAQTALQIEQLDVRLDVLSSLLSREVVFSSLLIDGLSLELQETEPGRWRIPAWPEKESSQDKNPFGWLLSQGEIVLSNMTLRLHPQSGNTKKLSIPSWGLRCGLTVCASQGSVTWNQGEHELNFSLNVFGKPHEDGFRLEGYLSTAPIQLTDWTPLFNLKSELVNDIQSLMVGGKVWFDWQGGTFQDVRGTLDLPQIELGREHDAMSAIDFLHSDFSWTRNTGEENERWALWLSGLTFKYAGELFEPAQRRLSLIQRDQYQVARLIADRMTLEPVVSTLLALDSLPDKLRDALGTLHPTGELQNLHIEYRLPSEDEAEPWFRVESQLENVSVSAWRYVPQIRGVTGYLQVMPESGEVDFVSDDFQLHFPQVFSNSWQFEQAKGVVNWVNENQTFWLSGHDLKLSGKLGEVTGSFRSLSGKDDLEPRLSLLIGLQNSRLPDALVLVPDEASSPELVSWLNQAFSQGDVSSARFVMDHNVTKGAPSISRTLALDVDATNVDFSFHADWPHLTEADVNVQIRDQQVSVQADKARFFDIALDQLEAFYQGERGATRLQGHARMKGPLSDAWRVLTETPLKENLFELGQDFQFKGLMANGRLDLDIPFSDVKKSRVDVSFTTKDAALDIPSVGVAATAIDGDFDYSSQGGLNAPNVSLSMFGFPAQAQINSQKTKQGVSTAVDLQGRLQPNALSSWVPPSILSRLQGVTDFKAGLSLGAGVDNQLLVSTDLQGIKVDLPQPLAKASDERRAFIFRLPFSHSQVHELNYDNQFAYALRFAEGSYQNGEIRLGSGAASYRSGTNIRVEGFLPVFDYQQWFDTFDQIRKTESGVQGGQPAKGSFVDRIETIKLDVGLFRFLDNDYKQVSFNVGQTQGNWAVAFENEVAKGALNYYRDMQKPLQVSFETLRLPVSENPKVGDESNNSLLESHQDVLRNVVPQALPSLDFRVNQLFVGEQSFGGWAFNLRPNPEGVRLESLELELRGVKAKGDIDWRQGPEGQRSTFSGSASIPDVAAMLKAWGKPAAVEGKNATFKGQLAWPGSPANFSLLSAQGLVTLEAKQGRIIDMQSIRLLGVLNFNTLSRRLRLDFSDLFKKGFSFEHVAGQLFFDNGLMRMKESLIIDGPSAKFKIDGQTDLVNEQFDHDVIVVLPVKDNIPILATLAGFPQVGVPMYLFNRAFGDVLDRFTSANYRVTGSWDDPEIKLTSFFDTQTLPESSESSRPKRGRN